MGDGGGQIQPVVNHDQKHLSMHPGEEREREGAKFYFYSSLVFAIFFAGGCFAAVHERSSHGDWFPVIFFGAMAGVCAFCALVLGAVLYFQRED